MGPKPAGRRNGASRTPDERADDAAKAAATSFEKLPSSPFADDYLKPIALFLRFMHRTSYLDDRPLLRDPRALAELERTLNDALRRFEHDAELMPVRNALQVERLTAKARRDLHAMKARIALAAEAGQG